MSRAGVHPWVLGAVAGLLNWGVFAGCADAASAPTNTPAPTAGPATSCADFNARLVDLVLARFALPADATTPAAEQPTAAQLAKISLLPAHFDVLLSSPWLSIGRHATVSFKGKSITSSTNPGGFCVKAFINNDPDHELPIEKIYLATDTDGESPAIDVQFRVRALAGTLAVSKVTYTFVGYFIDAPVADGAPVVFSTDVWVTARWLSVVLAVLFVALAYAGLAWITYRPGTSATPRGAKWIGFVLNPIRITAGAFGDPSLSQVQVVLFTLIVAGLLFQQFVRTGTLSAISMQLLYLLGISAVTSGTAKFTATLKSNPSDTTSQYLMAKGWYDWPLEPLSQRASLGELLRTDGRLDVYKFQMAIFTVVVAVYVIFAGQTDLADVKISETMLYLIGISQGVYVGGKAVTDRTTDLENAVAKMIELEPQIQSLTQKIEAQPAPPDLAELKSQCQARVQEYAKAAKVAVEEFSPLLHRMHPRPAGTRNTRQIDPDVLKPDFH
jgi:hypothetical protein